MSQGMMSELSRGITWTTSTTLNSSSCLDCLDAHPLLSKTSNSHDLSSLSFPDLRDGMMEVFIEDNFLWTRDNLTLSDSSSTTSFDELEPYNNFRDSSRFWIQRVLLPILMVIGVIGNSITIIIMTRRRMRSSTNNYLAALAIFDLLYLFFTFVLGLQHYPQFNVSKYYVYQRVRQFSLLIADCSSNCSVWLTVTFTIERYIVVSHPIQGKVICTESRARKVVLCVFALCFLYTLPTPFEWEIVEEFDSKANETIYKTEPSVLGNNEDYMSIYSRLTATFFTFIPLLLLAIFNSFLIRSVHVSRKQRSDMTQSKSQVTTSSATPSPSGKGNDASSKGRSHMRSVMTTSGVASRLESASSKQETKITIMLIAVVILFFVCQMPTAVMLIFTSVHQFPEESKEYRLMLGLNNIFNFLLAINAAGNFLLYCFFSQRYRKTFLTLFCPCARDKLAAYLTTSTHPNTTVYSSRNKSRDNKDKKGRTDRTDNTEMASLKRNRPARCSPSSLEEGTLPMTVHTTQQHDNGLNSIEVVSSRNCQPYV